MNGPMLKSSFSQFSLEVGVDEAGRGCLAGPVFAASVILPGGYQNPLLNDSKKLTLLQRNTLRKIIESEALFWAVGTASVEEIDRMNILQATFLSMHRAIENLKIKPEFLIIDGNRFKPYHNIPHQTIVRGDGLFQSIAAASVLAKTHRDEYMQEIDLQFPNYGWRQNKGYGTAFHRKAISQFGSCRHHRQSFTLLKRQMCLFE